MGHGERRVRGTRSLLTPGPTLEEKVTAFVRSIRITPLH
jgi:hypothetical protein